MRYIKDSEAQGLKAYFDKCLELARNSDCKEAQYGAIIVKDGKVIGEGYNHVPDELREKYDCDRCPRRNADLHKGIGLELCISTHAEEAAVQDMMIKRQYKKEESENAQMVIGKMKNGNSDILQPKIKLYCTKCAGKIAKETMIKEVIFLTSDGYVAIDSIEFLTASIKGLEDNWRERFSKEMGI